MRKSILVVDDEKPILKTFQRMFHGSDFDIYTADHGQMALDILSRENIDMIISDMKMPNMNGHELLRRVKATHPDAIRIILSGHAEEKEISRALRDGSCKMYILKPWDTKVLKRMIPQLLSVWALLQEKKSLIFSRNLESILRLPPVVAQVMELIQRDADIAQIVDAIETEPLLNDKVLEVVNSLFSGVRTVSVQQAIGYVGLTAVRNILLAASLCEEVPSHAGWFSKENLWQYAATTNNFVNRLHFHFNGKGGGPVASAVGLLSKIGLMALVRQIPDTYAQIAKVLQRKRDCRLDDLEREMIGVTHPEAGGYLLDSWGLPHTVVESVLFQYDPFHESVNDRNLVASVHIGGSLAVEMITGHRYIPVDERAFALFNMTSETCKRLILEKT